MSKKVLIFLMYSIFRVVFFIIVGFYGFFMCFFFTLLTFQLIGAVEKI